MNHWEMENAVSVAVALNEAGFAVSQICCSRPSCFDFAARKEEKTLLVKFQSDIDHLSSRDGLDISVIAERISAAPLIIGQMTNNQPLDDDTVYSRYNVFAITKRTLERLTLRKAFPLIHASPGGYSVEIDGLLVARSRKALGLSTGRLAEMIGVSRGTLYGYERGMTRASVPSAYKLNKTLGVPVAKPIDVLESSEPRRQCLLHRAKQAIVGKTLLRRVLRKFAFCNIASFKKAPFDFVMTLPREEELIIGSVVLKGERYLERRVEEIVSYCQVVEAHPVFFSDQALSLSEDIICLSEKDLSAMHTKDLIEGS